MHDEAEVDRVIPVLKLAPAEDRALFGVNNRDLRTFDVDRRPAAALPDYGLQGSATYWLWQNQESLQIRISFRFSQTGQEHS